MKSPGVVAICILSLASLLMTGCVKGCSTPSGRAMEKQKSVLRVHLFAEPVTIDPSLGEDMPAMGIIHNVMDGLVGYDGNGKLENRLAQAWTVSKDGKRYEFLLRAKALWSDGIPVVPADFVTGFRRALAPQTHARLAQLLMPIRGAQAYHAGAADLPGVFEQGGRLVIELEAPTPYFLDALTLTCATPLRKDILDENGGHWPTVGPSTGAYKVAAYQLGHRFLLDANENYWGGKPAMPLVDLLIVQDEALALSDFEKGDLDILVRIPSPDFKRLDAAGLLHRDPMYATNYLGFNQRKAPGRDRGFRRAIAGVINREAIVAELGTGDLPARSWIPPGLSGYQAIDHTAPIYADSVKLYREKHPTVDPKAAALLASFDSSARNSLIMEKVRADLEQGLGLSVLLSNMDWKSYVASLQSGPTLLFRSGWLSPFNDPISHLKVFTTGNLNNYTGWSNSEYDRLVGEIDTLPNGPERLRKIQRAEHILIDEEAVIAPILYYTQQYAVSARLRGARFNPFGTMRFSDISPNDAGPVPSAKPSP